MLKGLTDHCTRKNRADGFHCIAKEIKVQNWIEKKNLKIKRARRCHTIILSVKHRGGRQNLLDKSHISCFYRSSVFLRLIWNQLWQIFKTKHNNSYRHRIQWASLMAPSWRLFFKLLLWMKIWIAIGYIHKRLRWSRRTGKLQILLRPLAVRLKHLFLLRNSRWHPVQCVSLNLLMWKRSKTHFVAERNALALTSAMLDRKWQKLPITGKPARFEQAWLWLVKKCNG